MNFHNLINPLNEDGSIDHRYRSITAKVLEQAGQEVVDQLSNFYEESLKAEAKYESSGIRFVSAFFQVAMDDWQRRALKKRLRECLSELGFRPSKVSRLLKVGGFIGNELFAYEDALGDWGRTEEEIQVGLEDKCKYFYSYGLTGLYEIARMNVDGQTRAYMSYRENECEPISTRELQRIQLRYPEKTMKKNFVGNQLNAGCSPNIERLEETVSMPLDGSGLLESSDNFSKVQALVMLSQTIDWLAVQNCEKSIDLLHTSPVSIDWIDI